MRTLSHLCLSASVFLTLALGTPTVLADPTAQGQAKGLTNGQFQTHSAVGPTAQVVAMTNQPIHTEWEGIGANVTAMSNSIIIDKMGGQVGSAYAALPVPSDDAHWNAIFQTMDWQGLDWIRLNMEMNDYEPEKGQFAWNSSTPSTNWQILLKILDWAQKNHVDVLLQQQDQATNWNTIPGQEAWNSAPNDLSAFSDGFARMVKYLVKTEGYRCIRMVNITNEPANPWGWWRGGDIQQGYAATRKAMDALGLNNVPLAGTEYFNNADFNFNWDNIKQYLGVWENHGYPIDANNTFAPRPISDPAYPVLWGEFGGANNTDFNWNLTTLKWQLGGLNNGVDGFARWSYLNQNNIDGDFSYIRTYDTASKKLLDRYYPTANLYYEQGMLSRFTAQYSTVHAISTSDSNLIPTYLTSPNGAQTLVVLNEGKTDKQVSFQLQGLDHPVVLYRYELTQDQALPVSVTPGYSEGNTSVTIAPTSGPMNVNPEDPSFTAIVPRGSVVVYSTYDLNAGDPGVVNDGSYRPVSSSTIEYPISANDSTLPLSSLSLKGDWSSGSGALAQQTSTIGDSVSFSFSGTNFRLYGQQQPQGDLSAVYVDGQFDGFANSYAPLTMANMMEFDSGRLSPGQHTVQIVNQGKETVTGTGTVLSVEAVGVNQGNVGPGPAHVTPVARVTLSAPPAAVDAGSTLDTYVTGFATDGSTVPLSDADITFSSSNPSLASVSPEGQVTAAAGNSGGTATITVTVQVPGQSPLTASLNITVYANQVKNSGFEQLNSSGNMFANWTLKTATGRPQIIQTQSGQTHTGANSFSFWDNNKPYDGTLSQTITGLANGYYQPSLWLQTDGHLLRLTASGYDASGSTTSLSFPKRTDQWTQFTMKPILVANGQVTLTFHSVSGGGNWCNIDDVGLFQVPHDESPLVAVHAAPYVNPLPVGQSTTMVLYGTLQDGSADDLDTSTITYTSSNPQVATVDSTGTITALYPGQTSISVTVTRDGITMTQPTMVTIPPVVPGQNLVWNPGFEQGFTDWTTSGNGMSISNKSGNVHSGTYAANFYTGGAFDGTVSQTLHVPNGTYTVSVWANKDTTVNSKTGQPSVTGTMTVSGTGKMDQSVSFSSGSFTQYTLSSVQVTSGELTISLHGVSDGSGYYGGWMNVDDVSVVQANA